MRIHSAIIFSLFLSACASTDMKPQLERGMGGIPTAQYAEAKTVEEIRVLKPQAQFPLKIVVMPPSSWNSFSQGERGIIEKWGNELKNIGFASSLEIVPKSLIPSCGYKSDSSCFLRESRAAGARMGADPILFINVSTVTDRYVNPLSVLNLTVVGMWFIPAHHRNSYSVYESSLFDINNGYLYVVAEGRGEYKTVRPYMYVEHGTGQQEARIIALNELGTRLFSLAKEQMRRVDSPNKPLEPTR